MKSQNPISQAGMRARIAALPPGDRGLDAALALLAEVQPLDQERLAEMRVWLAFTSRALVEPDLRDLRDRAHAGLRELCRDALSTAGAPVGDREAEALHAQLDGLALHAVLDPARTTPARQLELITDHLKAALPAA